MNQTIQKNQLVLQVFEEEEKKEQIQEKKV